MIKSNTGRSCLFWQFIFLSLKFLKNLKFCFSFSFQGSDIFKNYGQDIFFAEPRFHFSPSPKKNRQNFGPEKCPKVGDREIYGKVSFAAKISKLNR